MSHSTASPGRRRTLMRLPLVAFVWWLSSLHPAWAAPVEKVIPPPDWLEEEYRDIYTMDEVPQSLVNLLLAKMSFDPRLAEGGEPFNEAEVIDPRLPRRRFMFAAYSTNFILVAYEHGGRGLHYHLAAFTVEAGKPKLIFGTTYTQRMELDALKKIQDLVRRGKLKNQIGDPREEW